MVCRMTKIMQVFLKFQSITNDSKNHSFLIFDFDFRELTVINKSIVHHEFEERPWIITHLLLT